MTREIIGVRKSVIDAKVLSRIKEHGRMKGSKVGSR